MGREQEKVRQLVVWDKNKEANEKVNIHTSKAQWRNHPVLPRSKKTFGQFQETRAPRIWKDICCNARCLAFLLFPLSLYCSTWMKSCCVGYSFGKPSLFCHLPAPCAPLAPCWKGSISWNILGSVQQLKHRSVITTIFNTDLKYGILPATTKKINSILAKTRMPLQIFWAKPEICLRCWKLSLKSTQNKDLNLNLTPPGRPWSWHRRNSLWTDIKPEKSEIKGELFITAQSIHLEHRGDVGVDNKQGHEFGCMSTWERKTKRKFLFSFFPTL